MAKVVIMPKLGLTMTSGAVARWNVAEGEAVAVGDIIVEVMTEKITYQVDAQAAGLLLKIVVPEGGEVPCGATIGVIGQAGEDVASLLDAHSNGGAPDSAGGELAEGAGGQVAEPGNCQDGDQACAKTRVPASPAARKLALELGIDLQHLAGTGPGGRITVEDVRAGEDRERDGARASAAPEDGSPVAGPAVISIPSQSPSAAPMVGGPTAACAAQELPYSGMRRAIGEHMAASWSTSPMVTHHVRADVNEVVRLLGQVNEGRSERDKISITSVIVKAVAASIRAEPAINASLDGETIRLWPEINIGVAVAVPEGLIVPVVKGADRKALSEIAREVGSLARRARKNKLLPEDVSGGTFTVTSLGGYRSVDWFTPIINQPEAAILGVGRVIDDVVAVGGAAAVRPTMGLSLTFDHRIIDGAPAAEFLRVLLGFVENPVLMLV